MNYYLELEISCAQGEFQPGVEKELVTMTIYAPPYPEPPTVSQIQLTPLAA